jgi:hypothetical protein
VPTAGGYHSVAVASYIPGEGFGVDWTASMRMHVDVGAWDQSGLGQRRVRDPRGR